MLTTGSGQVEGSTGGRTVLKVKADNSYVGGIGIWRWVAGLLGLAWGSDGSGSCLYNPLLSRNISRLGPNCGALKALFSFLRKAGARDIWIHKDGSSGQLFSVGVTFVHSAM